MAEYRIDCGGRVAEVSTGTAVRANHGGFSVEWGLSLELPPRSAVLTRAKGRDPAIEELRSIRRMTIKKELPMPHQLISPPFHPLIPYTLPHLLTLFTYPSKDKK